MDHSNSTNWLHATYEVNQPIHAPLNPHLAEQACISTPVSQYRANPPVNHQQVRGSHHSGPPPNAADFASSSFSQFPVGPFPQQENVPQWTQWELGLAEGGGGGPYSSHAGPPGFEHSPALDLYNSDPMSSWHPKLNMGSASSSNHHHAHGSQPESSYTAFSAFLHTASPATETSHLNQSSSQPQSALHSPAISPLQQVVPLAHASPPSFVNQFHRSQSHGGAPTSHPPGSHQSFTGSYSQLVSPSRPGIQYHTEPSRRMNLPLSARSMPSDWQAAYARSVTEQRVRAQSTSHIPLLTGAPLDWTALQPSAPLTPDGFSVLGLSLGDEHRHAAEAASGSSSDGGFSSDWGPGLIPAEEWQNQTVPPTEFASSGMVAGRFDNDHHHLAAQASELAGPSSVKHQSPALGNRHESLELGPSGSPQSRGSSQLSTPKSTLSTAFSAYDPQAPSTDGRKARVQRRKPNEPPRNPNSRRYPCPLCVETPRTFARPSALKIHMLTHTKEKPHTCSVCLRAFAIPSNLKRHLKLHAKDGSSRGSLEGTTPDGFEEAEEAIEEEGPDDGAE